MLSPRRIWTVITPYLPKLNGVSTPLGYETILVKNHYYTRLKFNNSYRPSKLDILFPSGYQIESKPWKKVATDLYYKAEGEFIKEENYWSGGVIPFKDSILELKDDLNSKESEAEVVAKLEDMICVKNSAWDWSDGSQRATLLKEQIPPHLKHRRTKIIKEIESAYDGFMALSLKPAGEDKFLIVITGRTGTQKTKLAKLIVARMAQHEIVARPKSFALWKEQDLTDMLPFKPNQEVIILDDYSGRNHNHGILDRLTCEDTTDLRVMRDYSTNRYIKGVIIPSPHPLEKWVTENTATLDTLEQEIRRAECNLYLFSHLEAEVKRPTWEHFKNRLFYVGNIRRWIYQTLLETIPDLRFEPLWDRFRNTKLAQDLAKLFHLVVHSLYKDKAYWNGYFDRSKVPNKFWSYQPETHLWAEPNTIRMFKLPSYEWLRDKTNQLKNTDLFLPVKEIPTFPPPKQKEPTLTAFKLMQQRLSLDIETEAIKDSGMKQLEIKSIQIDNQFIKVTPENKPQLQAALKGKEIIVFNSIFEQTQLHRSGFDIWSNEWKDVSLLAKLVDNRLAEERIERLEDMEEHFLKTTRKKNLLAQLMTKYRVRSKNALFKHPNLSDDPLFQEYGLNDTKITQELYDMLIQQVDPPIFKVFQTLQDKLSRWQMKGIPFPRDKIEAARNRLAASQQATLDKIVDIRVGKQKTTAGLKGWRSVKLVTTYIRNYKSEWIPYLEPTEAGQLSFDKEARERLMEAFPEDKILRPVVGLRKKAMALQYYDKLLRFADKDRFYPNYLMLGAASGRFEAREPDFQNLPSKPWTFFDKENPDDYNVRDTLLGGENVFAIDFANQEDRMRAYLSEEPNEIKVFLDGGDPAGELAEKLNIDRNKAKTVRHGVPYGRGAKSLKHNLGCSTHEAQGIRDSFWDSCPTMKQYVKDLKMIDEVRTPLLGRKIQFSQTKDYTRFNWQVQGGCVDLLLVALEYIWDSEVMELRGHFHDGLYLACYCQETHPGCRTAERFKAELEALYPIYWPGTQERVFKFGNVEWIA